MIKNHNNMEVAPIPEQDSSSEEETLDEIKHYDGNDTELQTFTSQASGHSAIFKVGDSKIAKPCNPHEALVYEVIFFFFHSFSKFFFSRLYHKMKL